MEAPLRIPQPASQPARLHIPNFLPYVIAGMCTSLASGGMIFGVGPFGNRMVHEGYLVLEDVSFVFTGGFQIMTCGSIIVIIVENRLGPRISAAMGACLALTGHIILANLSIPTNRYVVMVAYGLLGWGGNHIYFSTFQFAQLFPNNVGLADGIISGLFNSAGLIFTIFNVPGVTISRFFHTWMYVEICALILILIFWPDRAFKSGDRAYISWPTSKYVKKICNPQRRYKEKIHSILTCRFMLYALTFSWSCAIVQYINGQVGIYHTPDIVGNYYSKWAFPLIASPTILFTWLVGHTIDKTGFAWVSLILILCNQLSLLCLFETNSVFAAWCNLVLLNWLAALQYTIQFVFLHKNFKHGGSFAFIVVLIIQAIIGFVPTALSPNPWGRDFIPPLLIFAIPTILLYAWPVYECKERKRRLIERENPSRPIPPPSPKAAAAKIQVLGTLGPPSSPSSPSNGDASIITDLDIIDLDD